MFTKSQRYSFRRGLPAKSYNSFLFRLRYQGNDQGKVLCAFVIGLKVNKKATVRHKIKRRFANALREVLKNKSIAYDLVFFINKESLDKTYLEIKQEIVNVLEKCSVL